MDDSQENQGTTGVPTLNLLGNPDPESERSSLTRNIRCEALPELQRKILLEESLKLLRVAEGNTLTECQGEREDMNVQVKVSASAERQSDQLLTGDGENDKTAALERYLVSCRRALNRLAKGMTLRRLERPKEAIWPRS